MAQASSSRTYFIGGNWKCNLNRKEVIDLCKGLASTDTSKVEVLVAPVALHLALASELLSKTKIHVSSQNVSATQKGAYTGEIAPDQLVDYDIKWSIIGHSERRSIYHETDAVVQAKVKNALKHGLSVKFFIFIIVCLGETKAERDAKKVQEVCLGQLKAIVGGIEKNQWDQVVIAYEPVWAIGTGDVCGAKEAQEVCQLLRFAKILYYVCSNINFLKDNVSGPVANATRILYGGSVKADNALELIQQPDIDGFLVGGASLKVDSFGGIIKACQQASS
ncbi:triosephosphate isomerase [Reticulomyxa filosa]|uniref:Triosephosphate isomerase n=1 Tax=Reticulomyxa filosa TaxID=46433 RepID=X6PBL3_RETFI|nr:triosephosphate isomerase [Reticulomyxa filosa]|eukprot:ETO35508.1 triosephosphate isomerase [Reticulomyxa filosa]